MSKPKTVLEKGQSSGKNKVPKIPFSKSEQWKAAESTSSDMNPSTASFLGAAAKESAPTTRLTPSPSTSKNILRVKASPSTRILYSRSPNNSPKDNGLSNVSVTKPNVATELAVDDTVQLSEAALPKEQSIHQKLVAEKPITPRAGSISLSSLPRYNSSYKDGSEQRVTKNGGPEKSGVQNVTSSSVSHGPTQNSSKIPVALQSPASSKNLGKGGTKSGSKHSRPTTPSPSSSPNRSRSTKSRQNQDLKGKSGNASVNTSNTKSKEKKEKWKPPPPSKPFCPPRGHDYFHAGHDDCLAEKIDEDAVREFLDANPIFLNSFVDECVEEITIMNWIHFKSPPTKEEINADSKAIDVAKEKHRKKTAKPNAKTEVTERETAETTRRTDSAEEYDDERTGAMEEDQSEGAATIEEDYDEGTDSVVEDHREDPKPTQEEAEGTDATEENQGEDTDAKMEERDEDAHAKMEESDEDTDAKNVLDGNEHTATTKTLRGDKKIHCVPHYHLPPYYSACIANVAMPVFTLPPCCTPMSKQTSRKRGRSRKKVKARSTAEDNNESTTQASASAPQTSETNIGGGTTDEGSATEEDDTTAEGGTSGTTGSSRSKTKTRKSKKCAQKTAGTSKYIGSQMMSEAEIWSFMELYGVDLRQVRL